MREREREVTSRAWTEKGVGIGREGQGRGRGRGIWFCTCVCHSVYVCMRSGGREKNDVVVPCRSFVRSSSP